VFDKSNPYDNKAKIKKLKKLKKTLDKEDGRV